MKFERDMLMKSHRRQLLFDLRSTGFSLTNDEMNDKFFARFEERMNCSSSRDDRLAIELDYAWGFRNALFFVASLVSTIGGF